MGYIGTRPTAAPLTSADLADNIVTAAKIASDAVETAKVKDVNVTAGKLAATQDLSTKTITLPASVSGLGTGITNAQLAGSITDAKITGLTSSKLTGALPAISGVSLTSLNATNLGSGTVPTARLGTGAASSAVFLAGDNTWAAPSGGTILQAIFSSNGSYTSDNTDSFVASGTTIVITPTSVSSKIYLLFNGSANVLASAWGAGFGIQIQRGGSKVIGNQYGYEAWYREVFTDDTVSRTTMVCSGVDEPNTTSEVTYEVYLASHANCTMRLTTDLPRSFLALEY